MVKAVVPPSSLVAVAVGVAAFETIRLVMFHIVTRLAPVVAPAAPVPTKSRSVVPSKNSKRGEHVPWGLPPPFMFLSFDIAGTGFSVSLARNVSVYSAGLVLDAVCVPQRIKRSRCRAVLIVIVIKVTIQNGAAAGGSDRRIHVGLQRLRHLRDNLVGVG